MKRRLFTSLLLGLILFVGNGGWGKKTAVITVKAQSRSSEIFQLVNQVRADHGLTPFTYNAQLAAAAQNQAGYMAEFTYYGHTGYGGTIPQDRANNAGYVGYVVENVVGGWELSSQQAVTWWINSPVHYNTLITTRYAEAGTGYVQSGKRHFYVLVVGRRSSSPPANPAASTTSTDDAPAYVAPIIISQPREDGSVVHQVQPGQSLWAIAARYNVKMDELLLFNNLTEDAFIQPGDELLVKLGAGQSPPPTPTPPLNHLVREGETAWTIAAKYKLDLATLFLYNNLNEDSIIRPGDSIMVRLAPGQAPPPTPTPRTTHIVQEGDTLWVIAIQYNLTLDELLAYNGLDQSALIRPGDQLRIIMAPTATATALPVTAGPSPSPASVATAVIIPIPDTTASPTPMARETAVPVTALPSLTPTPTASENPTALNIWYLFAGLLTLLGVGAIIAGRRI